MIVVLVALAATLAIQLGYFLWKLSADSLPRLGEASLGVTLRGFLGNGKWLAGTALTIVGWLLFIKASDLGEISIVQPLMSVGDLFLVLLAVVFLHERMTAGEWGGLFLTVLGAVILATEASVVAPEAIDWAQLTLLLVISPILGLVLFLAGTRGRNPEVSLGIVVGVAFGIGSLLTELMTAYISIQGGVLESLDFLLNPILPFMILANMVGLFLLQMAFQRGRAAVIVPVQLAMSNVIVLLGGMLVFSESLTWIRFLAIALIVAGTSWLQNASSHQTQP